MKIVFSTTKQWNPGDELILAGVRNLLGEHTFIMFNRHPHLNSNRKGDNSYVFGIGNEHIDHIIFAGSPEYYEHPNDDLYKLISECNTPFSYIGVGGPPNRNDRPFAKATVAFARDNAAGMIPNSMVAPCPSIYAVTNMNPKVVKDKKKIAFCYQANSRYICSPSEQVNQVSKQFINKYNPTVICHSYIDYAEAVSNNWNVLYSSETSDYFKFYKDFDLIVGTRIHGSGWGAAYGIPSITIAHDSRASTASKFGSVVCNHNELFDVFAKFNCEVNSKNIIDIRKKWLPIYLQKLEPIFGKAIKFK
jgi:hypothetical protein